MKAGYLAIIWLKANTPLLKMCFWCHISGVHCSVSRTRWHIPSGPKIRGRPCNKLAHGVALQLAFEWRGIANTCPALPSVDSVWQIVRLQGVSCGLRPGLIWHGFGCSTMLPICSANWQIPICPIRFGQTVEHPKRKSTQPRSQTKWKTLYFYVAFPTHAH